MVIEMDLCLLTQTPEQAGQTIHYRIIQHHLITSATQQKAFGDFIV